MSRAPLVSCPQWRAHWWGTDENRCPATARAGKQFQPSRRGALCSGPRALMTTGSTGFVSGMLSPGCPSPPGRIWSEKATACGPVTVLASVPGFLPHQQSVTPERNRSPRLCPPSLAPQSNRDSWAAPGVRSARLEALGGYRGVNRTETPSQVLELRVKNASTPRQPQGRKRVTLDKSSVSISPK